MFALKGCLIAGIAILPLSADEDEWYDPSDWFDGNNVETAGTDYDWWDNRGWYDTYDYYDYYTPYYSYYWDPVVTGWTRYEVQSDSNSSSSNVSNNSNNSNDSSASNRSGSNNRSSGKDRGMTRFEGKVDGFKKVNLTTQSGQDEEHSFVRVRLRNGDSQIISLGSRVNVADLDLSKGDRIEVSGKSSRIDNRDVLVAHRIETGGETFNIREKNRPETGQQVSVQGKIEDYRQTSLSDNAREQNLIVRLEMKDGKNCVVDLGQGTSLQDLDLEEGSNIRLEGEKTQVDGKSLIIARKIHVDGEKTRLRNKQMRQNQQSGDNSANWSGSRNNRNQSNQSNVNTRSGSSGNMNSSGDSYDSDYERVSND